MCQNLPFLSSLNYKKKIVGRNMYGTGTVPMTNVAGNIVILTWAQISGRQTSVLTRGAPPLLYNKCGGEPRVKPGVWRPEMWALNSMQFYLNLYV
jgi:hypothetical protein